MRNADLSGGDPSRTNLADADLTGAILVHANLSEADLREATLVDANLTGANLANVFGSNANLSGANLQNVNFSKPLFDSAQLVRANLAGASFTGAELQATVPDYMEPFVSLVQCGQPVFGMFDDLPRKYDWALPLLEHSSADSLLAAFENKVVAPALEKLGEVRRRKALPPSRRSAED